MSAPQTCPRCGAANALENVFCLNCGTRLLWAMPPTSPPPGVPPAYTTAWAPPYSVPYPPYPYVPPRRSARAGDLLSAVFEVWTKNFGGFFSVYLLVAVINGLISGILSFLLAGTFTAGSGVLPGTPNINLTNIDLARLIAFLILAAAASIILNSIVLGGMTEFAVRRFRGTRITVGDALRRGFQKYPSVLGANVLIELIVGGLVLFPLVLLLVVVVRSGPPFVLSQGTIAVLCGGLIVLAFAAVFAIYLAIAFNLFAPAIMMEKVGAVQSLRRSWALTRGHRLSIFGAFLAISILAGIIAGAIAFPAALTQSPIVILIATALASALVAPWTVILAAVAYDLIGRQPSYGVMPAP